MKSAVFHIYSTNDIVNAKRCISGAGFSSHSNVAVVKKKGQIALFPSKPVFLKFFRLPMGKIALTFSREALLIERNRGFMSERPKQWGHSLSSNESWGETGASGQCQSFSGGGQYIGEGGTQHSGPINLATAARCSTFVRTYLLRLFFFFFLRARTLAKGLIGFSCLRCCLLGKRKRQVFFVDLEKRKGTHTPGHV